MAADVLRSHTASPGRSLPASSASARDPYPAAVHPTITAILHHHSSLYRFAAGMVELCPLTRVPGFGTIHHRRTSDKLSFESDQRDHRTCYSAKG